MKPLYLEVLGNDVVIEIFDDKGNLYQLISKVSDFELTAKNDVDFIKKYQDAYNFMFQPKR